MTNDSTYPPRDQRLLRTLVHHPYSPKDTPSPRTTNCWSRWRIGMGGLWFVKKATKTHLIRVWTAIQPIVFWLDLLLVEIAASFPVNLVNGTSYSGGEAAEDVLSIQSTTGQSVSVPPFVFTCVPTWFLGNNLARGVEGMAGLGRSLVALPTQLAQTSSFQRKFATPSVPLW